MAVSEEYLDYVLEQLECVGVVVPKRMFGGVGLYLEGLFFAMIADKYIYPKQVTVSDGLRRDKTCRLVKS